ncbi:hypothetical protein AAVH_07436 [Aphelenchoides avenae]|nr:hypothetical protein AAVH_07436 [Aphelenchus avenae]
MCALPIVVVFMCAAQILGHSVGAEGIDSIEKALSDDPAGNMLCPKHHWAAPWGCVRCTACGNGLYTRSGCTPEKDTVCDWCLTTNPKRNADYEVKCADWIQVKQELDAIAEGKEGENDPKSATSAFLRDTVLKVAFCLTMVGILLVAFRQLKNARKSHRTVTIVAPLLDECDSKNIIRAAECIRGKLGKKGYEQLEEFV